MKTEFQVQSFLGSQSFMSEADWEMISIFCKKFKRFPTITPTYSPNGLTIATFTDWFNNGFGSGEVAEMDGELVILGRCSLDEAEIVAKKAADGFKIVEIRISTTQLLKVSENRFYEAIRALSMQGLQYSREKERITEKYLPSVNERVEFYNNSVRGLGVIRSISPEDNFIELYCYYIYTTDEIGYSMHETGVCTVHDFDFAPMSISCQRRMNRELEKYGKVWYEKLHRIEPLKVKAEVGGKYWYINDKMSVVLEREKGTPTSQFRYIAGNYFTSYEEAVEYLGKFAELLRDRLAKPEKNDKETDKQKTEGR